MKYIHTRANGYSELEELTPLSPLDGLDVYSEDDKVESGIEYLRRRWMDEWTEYIDEFN